MSPTLEGLASWPCCTGRSKQILHLLGLVRQVSATCIHEQPPSVRSMMMMAVWVPVNQVFLTHRSIEINMLHLKYILMFIRYLHIVKPTVLNVIRLDL